MNQQSDTLRNLLISAAIFLTFLWIAPRFFGPMPQKTAPDVPAEGTAADETPASVGGGTPGTATITPEVGEPPPASAAAPGAADDTTFRVIEAEAEQTVAMGSTPANGVDTKPDESPYRMRLTLSNVGASVESATMTDHAKEIDSGDRYELLSMAEGEDGSSHRSLAIERLTIDKVPLTLHDKKWQVKEIEPQTTATGEPGETVEFWIDIHQGDQPAVRLTRTFTLPQQSVKSGRHDLQSAVRVENLSAEPHSVIVTYRGGLGVRRTPAARMQDQYVDWGLFSEGRIKGTRKQYGDITKSAGQSLAIYTPSVAEQDARLSWAATANTYFTCTIAPLNQDGTDNVPYLTRVTAFDADGSVTTENDITLRFVTREVSLAAGQSTAYPAAIYLGQKDGKAFKGVAEYRSRNYYVQISQGFGWCTFTWLVELMIWLLNSLFFVVRDFGIAIMVLVLVVRVLLHPITKKGQVNMVRMQHRMQEMAPKIEEIKKKYANDKARLNQEMMKLNINPAGQLFTCLPMMLQMPIWIALFLSLSNNILMRHQGCLFLPWIHDLTAQDAIFTLPTPLVIPLVGWTVESFNVLPILVGVFMYTQQKLQPKPAPSPSASDQQRQQQEMMQKMMPMMSVMMLIIFYKMPAGLNLYIMASSLFGTIEQKRIRKHIKEREEAGTLHKADKKGPLALDKIKESKKPSWLGRLQKAAEHAQKTQAQRVPKTKRR